MNPIKLYHHKTSGGAEYLSNKFVTCPNGEKEGIFEEAEYVVRLDGQPELMFGNAKLIAAAPDLLAACQMALSALNIIRDEYKICGDTQLWNTLESAIKKATE